jgi:hypothetical protein
MENTQLPKNAQVPPTRGPRGRLFYAKNEQGAWRPIVLRYHVWSTGSGIHDAYEVVHSGKSLSYHQVMIAIEYRILIPVEAMSLLTPSRQAEYDAAA